MFTESYSSNNKRRMECNVECITGTGFSECGLDFSKPVTGFWTSSVEMRQKFVNGIIKSIQSVAFFNVSLKKMN